MNETKKSTKNVGLKIPMCLFENEALLTTDEDGRYFCRSLNLHEILVLSAILQMFYHSKFKPISKRKLIELTGLDDKTFRKYFKIFIDYRLIKDNKNIVEWYNDDCKDSYKLCILNSNVNKKYDLIHNKNIANNKKLQYLYIREEILRNKKFKIINKFMLAYLENSKVHNIEILANKFNLNKKTVSIQISRLKKDSYIYDNNIELSVNMNLIVTQYHIQIEKIESADIESANIKDIKSANIKNADISTVHNASMPIQQSNLTNLEDFLKTASTTDMSKLKEMFEREIF